MNTCVARNLAGTIRSKLFVPGSRPELFAKAAATQADALSFDLEDSVVESKKREAREHVATFLRSGFLGSSKVIIVRVNPLSSEQFQADVAAIVVPGLHVINLPKVESREDVIAAANIIDACEQATGVIENAGILANIETPKGLRLASEIASAHPRMVGLQMGFLDLSAACGIDPTNTTALNAMRLSVRLAAAEADIAAFDGAFADVQNIDAYRENAQEARALGMNGKSCIHPSQVAIANAVFTPAPDAIKRAARIVKAAAAKHDDGAFLLDGSMIDLPVITRAQRLIHSAERYGVLESVAGELMCQP